MEKNGFTLVELLAVIVTLAVILAIAIPSISGIISSSTRGAFESNAKMVLKQIDYKKLDIANFDPTTVNEGNIASLLGLSPINYSDVYITIEDNIPIITIVGAGKWNGLIACGSFKNMKVVQLLTDCSNDLIPPVITLLGDNPTNINTGDSYVDEGATALDNKDGDITNDIITTGTVNPIIAGTYTITYTVTDAAGNETVSTRTVNVVDVGAPTISFGTNGNPTYAKNRSTIVTVSDIDGQLDVDSLKYLWSTSTTTPVESSINISFTNGDTINTPVGVTGGYYLWVLGKDMAGNTSIQRTEVFNLDNTIPVITMIGSTPLTINVGSVYNDAGATALDDVDGNITGNIITIGTVNPNLAGTYTITYNVTDSSGNAATAVVRTVNVEYVDYSVAEGINKPKITTGMTPIKWDGSSWVITTENDSDWYNYTTGDKKWANARTADGSMWVWIPRYAYQIATNYHTSTVGTINVKFLKGTTNIASDDSTATTVPTYSGSSQTNFISHPAFTFGTTELTGIWVAKFEASGTTAAVDSKPNVISLRSLSVGNMFTASRNMETNSRYGWGTSGTGIDTHMMKNSEWGAVSYLSKSTFGKNVEIWINPADNYTTGCAGDSVSTSPTAGCLRAYNTTNGQKASTTGNIYGIYDMSGGAWEYVAAYVNNGHTYLSFYGSSITGAAARYKDVYTVTTDSADNNYNNAVSKKGDAVYETTDTSGTFSWYGKNSYMPNTNLPWFMRGGNFDYGADAGIFRFNGNVGTSSNEVGFRVVLSVNAGL